MVTGLFFVSPSLFHPCHQHRFQPKVLKKDALGQRQGRGVVLEVEDVALPEKLPFNNYSVRVGQGRAARYQLAEVH